MPMLRPKQDEEDLQLHTQPQILSASMETFYDANIIRRAIPTVIHIYDFTGGVVKVGIN